MMCILGRNFRPSNFHLSHDTVENDVDMSIMSLMSYVLLIFIRRAHSLHDGSNYVAMETGLLWNSCLSSCR